jgi:hypothetical protein
VTLRAIVVTLILTIVLTFFAVVGIMFELGDGGILFLAILGGAIAWLLPGSFAVALPAGAFGGALLTYAEYPAGEGSDEDPKREIVRLAVFASC